MKPSLPVRAESMAVPCLSLAVTTLLPSSCARTSPSRNCLIPHFLAKVNPAGMDKGLGGSWDAPATTSTTERPMAMKATTAAMGTGQRQDGAVVDIPESHWLSRLDGDRPELQHTAAANNRAHVILVAD